IYEPPCGILHFTYSFRMPVGLVVISPEAFVLIAYIGEEGPWALLKYIRSLPITGVGIGTSPPPDIHHMSFPVSKSYPPLCLYPFTAIRVLSSSLYIFGVHHPGYSSLLVFHSSFPVFRSKQAKNEFSRT